MAGRVGPAISAAMLVVVGCANSDAQTTSTDAHALMHSGSDCSSLAETLQSDVDAAIEAQSGGDKLTQQIVPCLGSPDPAVRDEFAYMSLAALLRAGAVSRDERERLLQHLSSSLSPDTEDDQGFARPFAALALSEVARTDRVDPWMSPEQRKALVEAGAVYLEGVSDYRGFIDGEGWRHGVAHGADLLMQLSLNEAIDEADAARMLEAIGAQVASRDAPAYIFDEPGRLSRPLLFLTQRGLLGEEDLTEWFEEIGDPAPLASWDDTFSSEAALARRHNLRAFGYAVLVSASENDDENLKKLRPGALHLLTTIP
ncbi:DUF2785 domain-containing protein [Henriciella sp. AS95]|uniref:DUF2785 domain-containing protein n=1 Tax=Henriciella sp. AS95 TaxID=3135782 RepID=UPI003172080A